MLTPRQFILAALEQITNGGDLTGAELSRGVPNSHALSTDERAAWLELQRWTEDDDLREKDAGYAHYKRDLIRDRFEAMRAIGRTLNE